MAHLYQRGQVWWIKYYKAGKGVRQALLDAAGNKVRSKRVAQMLKTQIENDIYQGKHINHDITLEVAVQEYLNQAKKKKAANTYEVDHRILSRFLQHTPPMALKNLSTPHIQRFLDQYTGKFTPHSTRQENREKNVRPYTPKTYNNYLTVIKSFCNYCIRCQYLSDNPADRIPRMKIRRNPPRYLSRQEVTDLLAAAENSHLRPLILTLLYTGIRINEALSLDWTDIDLDRKQLLVRAETAKDAEYRAIPLHQHLIDALTPLRSPQGPVFLNTKGKPYAGPPDTAYATLLRQANIKNATWHTLRHTCGSWLAMNGVSIYDIQHILGHSDVRTTQVYAHLHPEYLEKQVNRLNFGTL